MSERMMRIVDELSSLTVLEAAELTKMLEEKWGVSASPAAVAVAAAAPAAAAEEQTDYSLYLSDVGAKKLDVIKLMKDVGFDLQGAKTFVEGDRASPFKTGVQKSDAEAMKAKFEAVGAKVTLK